MATASPAEERATGRRVGMLRWRMADLRWATAAFDLTLAHSVLRSVPDSGRKPGAH